MSQQIPIGITSLLAAAGGAVAIARAWPAPAGKHRAPAVPGQIAQQEFVHCATCGVETAATRHGSVLRCAEGHFVPAGGAL